MRFFHLADLHLGKSLHGVSLLDSGDQPRMVEELLELARVHRPQAVVLAGDVYDRGAPAAEAVGLLSRLLTGLTDLEIPVLLIPGNHDSAQRLAFGRELLSRQGLHIAPALDRPGTLTRVRIPDGEAGPVDFWLMPYVFPALVGQALDREELRDYDAAVRALLEAQDFDPETRRVLVAHQNVVAAGVEAQRGGSESMVGGVGQVEYTAFDGFDYVALGHIHGGYPVGRPGVRYAGAPLCYHFNETRQGPKGALLVELGEKGREPEVTVLPLTPLHPLRDLEGDYETLRQQALEGTETGVYLRLTLTDRRVTPEIAGFFHSLYESRDCLLMELTSSLRRSGEGDRGLTARETREKTLTELFSDFYVRQMGGAAPSAPELALLDRAAALMEGAEPGQSPGPAQAEALVAFAKEQEVNP